MISPKVMKKYTWMVCSALSKERNLNFLHWVQKNLLFFLNHPSFVAFRPVAIIKIWNPKTEKRKVPKLFSWNYFWKLSGNQNFISRKKNILME